MRKYLVVNVYFLPKQYEKGFTKTKVVEADNSIQALSRATYESFKNNNEWDRAVHEGRLEEATVAVYELVSGINELEG